MKKIETSKGRFGVKYYETWSELIIDANFYKLKLGVSIFKISEITEEEASEIVKQSYHTDLYAHYVKDIEVNMFCYESAIQSLHSLLESQGIEITPNTYIFKI